MLQRQVEPQRLDRRAPALDLDLSEGIGEGGQARQVLPPQALLGGEFERVEQDAEPDPVSRTPSLC